MYPLAGGGGGAGRRGEGQEGGGVNEMIFIDTVYGLIKTVTHNAPLICTPPPTCPLTEHCCKCQVLRWGSGQGFDLQVSCSRD